MLFPIHSKFCLFNGQRVHFLQSGSKKNPPLLLIHAFPVCAEMFQPLTKILSSHFFILAPDLPGFGSSDPLSHPSYESFVNFLSLFLDSQKITQTHLCGVSLGATLALKFTHQFPRRVKKLILNSPPVFSLIQPKRFQIYRRLIRLYPQPSQLLADILIKNHLVLYYYLYRPRYRCISSSLIKKIYLHSQNNQPSTILSILQELLHQDLRPIIPQLHHPTLLATGEKDYPELWKDSLYLSQNLPQVKFLPIPKATHTLAVSRHFYPLFAQNIIEFLT